MIYLDNSATTKPCTEAVEAIHKALTENWANPSALYGFGIDAARLLRTARHQVAAAMGADCVLVTTGHQNRETLEKLPALFVADSAKAVLELIS